MWMRRSSTFPSRRRSIGADLDHMHVSSRRVYMQLPSAIPTRPSCSDQAPDRLCEMDRAGDNTWIYEFYRVADSLQMEPSSHCTPTTSGSPSPTIDRSRREALRGRSGTVEPYQGHVAQPVRAWSLHEGRVGSRKAAACTRAGMTRCIDQDRHHAAPTRRKVEDLRIHIDVTGL